MKNSIYIIFITLSIIACKSNQNKSQKNIFWVDSSTKDCVGVGPKQCLQIKRTENGSWENFYDSIAGFSYETGYLYTLELEIDSVPKEDLAADQSMYSYRLLNVKSKTPDPKFRLNDIWVATHLNNTEINRSEKLPQIELSVKKMQLMGTDGCNKIRAKINTLTAEQISFGNVMGTKMLCPNSEAASQFNSALLLVTSYKFEQLKLHLYNKENEEIIRLLKID